jgi:hypothetical protein
MKRSNKKTIVENRVLAAISDYCKDLQAAGHIKDSNMIAKKISTKVAEGLLPAQQKKIYSKLTEAGTPVADIARKCKLSSKLVSAQLNQIHARTMLVGFKKDGKNKLWHKAYSH